MRRRVSVAMVGVAAAAAIVGVPVGLAVARDDAAPSRDARAAAVTTLPGRVVPTGDPVLPGTVSAHPSPGGVVRVSGPFDDRFTLTSLSLTRGTLRGTLTVTSDVSELIELQISAGFYDAKGVLLGTATYEKHGEGAKPNEVVPFAVRAPAAYAARTSSASVGVPVLVNE